jgi:hypothetical protein
MQIAKWVLVPAMMTSVLLTSCGGHNSSMPPPINPAAVLNGNWHLFGNDGWSKPPAFSMTMGVSGSTIYGDADFFVACIGSLSEGASDAKFSGAIAADGSFKMTNSAADSLQMVIQGQVPAKGSNTWNGSYTITGASGSSCPVNDTGEFTASARPAASGTYSGTLSGPSWGKGFDGKFSTTLIQGAFTSQTFLSGITDYYTPLSGTASMSGVPCFTTGQALNDPKSVPKDRRSGDVILLSYTMNDGSEVSFAGWFTDANETTLHVQNLIIATGKCATEYGSGTLTRQ